MELMLTIAVKTARPDHPILDLIAQRFSPRAFAEWRVEQHKLLSVLEAARWAPSSNNQQPWRFVVTERGSAPFEALAACLRPGNLTWAPRAPLLILMVAHTRFEAKGDKPARENLYAWHDLGLASGNLLLQATALGLHAHLMAGFDREQARHTFAIPEGFEPVTVLALGYLGDPEALPDDLRSAETTPRSRKPLSDLLLPGGSRLEAAREV